MKKFLIGVLVWSFVIAACVVLSACASAPEVAGGYGCTQAKTLSNGFDLRGVAGRRRPRSPPSRPKMNTLQGSQIAAFNKPPGGGGDQSDPRLIPDHRAFTECPLAWHFPGNN
jgi:hypothetical protein